MTLSKKIYKSGDQWIAEVYELAGSEYISNLAPIWRGRYPTEEQAHSAADRKLVSLKEPRLRYKDHEYFIITTQEYEGREARFYFDIKIYKDDEIVHERTKQEVPNGSSLSDAQEAAEKYAREWIDARAD
jgi:hypothetical protein